MYCQACGALNPETEEYCCRCHQKLLVLSGAATAEEAGFEEDLGEGGFSFDDHLLERISILEEAVKRTAESVRQLMRTINKQERSILIHQAGLATLSELLEGRRLLGNGEWGERWEEKMDFQLLALEKRERFVELRDRISGLYRGKKRKLFNQFLQDAEYALFAFDVERALSALEAAYRLDRHNYELAHFIGETHFNDGDSDRALHYFGRVLEAAQDHYEALVYSGVIYHERSETARAEELLRRAVALEPDAFLPNFSLGAVFASTGKLTRAAALLDRAVEIDPVPQALFLLGNCLFEMGKLTGAIRALEDVVRYDPAHEDAHHLLGLAYLDRRWNRKALAAFRRAQELNPKRMRYLDLVSYLSGRTKSPLPEVNDGARDWLARAEEALLANRQERALSSYRRALALDPDNPTLMISFALACLQMNRSREAEILTRRVLDLEPGEMLKATACATLIEALRQEGRLREGNRVGEKLLEEGDSGFARTIAYYEMAYNMAEMEGSLDQALEFARLSLDSSPEELKQFPLAALGWVHYKRREYRRAVDYLSKSSDLGRSAGTLTHLGMALLAAGEDEQARSVLSQARNLDVRDASLQQRMMECMKDTSRLLERVERRSRK